MFYNFTLLTNRLNIFQLERHFFFFFFIDILWLTVNLDN